MSETDAVPSESEIVAAVAGLERSRDALLEYGASLSAADWQRSDGPGRWTPAEILEHLVIAERRSLGLFEKMLTQPGEPDWRERTAGKDERLAEAAVPRGKLAAPAALHPQGGQAPEQLLSDFAAARSAVLAFALRPGQALKEHTREHPAFGALHGLQWLRLTGYHTERHLAQMRGCGRAPATATNGPGA